MKHPVSEHITDWSQINSEPYGCDLSHYQWLVIQGADAPTFLNGQATIKTIGQPDGTVQFGALCNLKGRVLASFWAFHVSAERIQLLFAPHMGDAMATHLAKYAVFSKVALSVEPAHGLMGCSINAWAMDTPTVNTVNTVSRSDPHQWLAHLYSPAPFFLVQNPPSPSNDFTHLSAEAWGSVLTASGLMMVDREHSEQWLPQQLNYDLFGAIHFDKGCYTGQEVVARLHYRGKTKDRLRSGIVTQQNECSLPHKLTTVEGDSAGTVTSWLSLSATQSVISGVIKTDLLDVLNQDSSLGPILWLDAKYAIPDQ